jgi:hypothetical protein
MINGLPAEALAQEGHRSLLNGLPAEALTQEGHRYRKITLENPSPCRNFNPMQALPR